MVQPRLSITPAGCSLCGRQGNRHRPSFALTHIELHFPQREWQCVLSDAASDTERAGLHRNYIGGVERGVNGTSAWSTSIG